MLYFNTTYKIFFIQILFIFFSGCGNSGSTEGDTTSNLNIKLSSPIGFSNGSSTTQITAQLLDNQNNPTSGHEIRFYTNRGNADILTPTSATTNAKGTAIAQISSTRNGSASLSATDLTMSDPLNMQTTLEFIDDPTSICNPLNLGPSATCQVSNSYFQKLLSYGLLNKSKNGYAPSSTPRSNLNQAPASYNTENIQDFNKQFIQEASQVGSQILAISFFSKKHLKSSAAQIAASDLPLTHTISNKKKRNRILYGKNLILEGLTQSIENNYNLKNTRSLHKILKKELESASAANNLTEDLNQDIASREELTSSNKTILKTIRAQSRINPTLKSSCYYDSSNQVGKNYQCDGTAIGAQSPSSFTQPGWNYYDPEGIIASNNQSLMANCTFPLKSSISCIKNQGQRGTCTAFAIIGAIETKIAYDLNQQTSLSAQALWYEVKAKWDTAYYTQDGYTLSNLAKNINANHYTIPYEYSWNYNPAYCIQPNLSSACTYSCTENETIWASIANAFATQFSLKSGNNTSFCSNTTSEGQYTCNDEKSSTCGYLTPLAPSSQGASLIEYVSIFTGDPNDDLTDVIAAINQGIPVATSIQLTQTFYNTVYSSHGVVPSPNEKDTIVGAHAFVIVGFIPYSQIPRNMGYTADPNDPYDPSVQGVFIAKNHWGTRLGDSGFFYINDNYLAKNAFEYIAIKEVDFQ